MDIVHEIMFWQLIITILIFAIPIAAGILIYRHISKKRKQPKHQDPWNRE